MIRRFCVFSLTAALAAALLSSHPALAEGVMETGVPPTSLGMGVNESPRVVHGRNIIKFLQPPIQTEIVPPQPPPSVTFRSDPKLRAQFPPNPEAKTVDQAFHQEFGELVRFEFDLTGDNEEELTRQATAHALMSLAGRVYFDGKILLAQDLLPNYLEQYGDRFVRSSNVSDRRVEGGQKHFQLSLIIDQDVLLKDLNEKTFIQRPQLHPVFFIFLKQTINGAADTTLERARRAMEDVIADRNQRYNEYGVPSMENPDVDISASREAFLEGRRAAQGNGVEVAFTGSIIARPADVTGFISQEDWNSDTLTVPVNVEGIADPVNARLPLGELLKTLEDALKAREAQGQREWWDVGSIEVDAPPEILQLTDEQRQQLAASGARIKAIVPVERLGLRRNYYSAHFFSTARLELKLVRIDNGEILGEATVETSSDAGDMESATQASINAAVDQAANGLIDHFLKTWPRTMLDESDFRVLASNVSEDSLQQLVELIQGSDPKAEVNIRSLLGNIGVLAVTYPQGLKNFSSLVERLEFPRFRVTRTETDALEIEQI